METESFLAEFSPVSTEKWEHAIRESVAGPDYPAKLIWHPEEGLAVRPYYRAEDLAGLPFSNAAPGMFPYGRGTRLSGDWRIREAIDQRDPETANRAACEAVAAGAEEISFVEAAIDSTSDVVLVLANLSKITVHFGRLTQDSARIVADRLTNRAHAAAVAGDLDPIEDLERSAALIRKAAPNFRPFAIDAGEFLERGAGAIEETGFAIAKAVEFLDEMQNRGISIERSASSIGFSFAIGPEFFVQIAKLRAFRMLWAQVVESFGANSESGKALIHARTARWNKTIYDPHVNILRATTEAISAVLGSADSIEVAPFDECYRLPEDSARRLARNTQLILKKEAHLSRVADPVGGSYLIESLTNSIATRAWKIFQELEGAGGYRKAKTEGVIDSVLEQRERARKQAVECKKIALTGTNRFVNVAENSMDRTGAQREDTTDRVAIGFEQLRRRTERAAAEDRSPRILLAEIGDAKTCSARSQFALDFLACAGLSAKTKRFDSAKQIAASDADVIVLCSSDPEYLPIAEALMPALKEGAAPTCVLVAGNPATANQIKKLGIAEFIHLRSNAVEVLRRLQKQIGIRA